MSAMLVAGFLNLSYGSMNQTLVQSHAPPEIRGRVIGLYSMASSGLRAFSGVTVGLLGWPILGWLRRRFDWWLQAEPGDRAVERRGAAILVAVLAVLTGLAHLLVTVTGGLP